MFMFRSKRTALAKRLWKARIRREHEAGGETKTDDAAENRDPRDFTNTDERTLSRNFLKVLKENQLEMLALAVEAGESGVSTCVMLPRNLVEEPHLKCCQTWRWSDLRLPGELKQLPVCESSSSKDPSFICCNPYHWSRICKPESPPPPYQRFARERLKPEDRAPSEGGGTQMELRGSLTTEDTEVGSEWCRLAYWELSRRVGRQFAVLSAAINVFWQWGPGPGGHHAGLSLETLALPASLPPPPVPEPVKRAREKIGRGVTLSREQDGVWAYNRSDQPIFVNSPTLDDPESRSHLVFRVPPGHCLRVWREGVPPPPPPPSTTLAPTGPIDRHSVRISFAKGWGPKYSRQEVTACPTWLEVLLAPCR